MASIAHNFTYFSRFAMTIGLIESNSMLVDERSGLIYSPIDAVLIQNTVNISIVIEASNEVLIAGGMQKFTNDCIRKKSGMNLTEEIERFSESRLNQRIKDALKRTGLPFGEVTSKTSKRRTVDPEASGPNLAGDDPEAAVQIITELDSTIDFRTDGIYKGFNLCFGRNLTNPKLELELESREKLSNDDEQNKIFSTSFLIKEQDTKKFFNIDIGEF